MEGLEETAFTASLPSHPSNLSNIHTVDADSPCFLTNIATELVHHIIDYIPPASHFDFACTCKHLFACSTDILKRHHDAHAKYRVSSDLHPATVPTLLRSAFGYGDPVPAWHVQSLEVWYDRKSWEEWKTLDFEIPVHELAQSPIAWDFTSDEIDDYLERLEQGQGRLVPTRIDEARTQIEDGQDIYLKALLIASCPRLRDVKFVMPARHEIGTKSCIGWLDTFINDSYNGVTSWGPGFEKLQSAAVGLPTGTWMDDAYHPHTSAVNIGTLAQFLRLPTLEKLYFRDCDSDMGNDDTPWCDFIPPGTSPIKHLFMDNCGEVSEEAIIALTAAPSSLVTASFRAGDALLEYVDSFVSYLGTYQGSTLESLMFYDYHDNRNIRGYRCSAFRPEELKNLRNLKHICMNVRDVKLQASYQLDDCREDWESDGAYLERCFLESFSQYEVVVLWGSLSNSYIHWEPNEEQGFEDAVISLIGTPETNLQAVYLGNVERSSGLISPSNPGRGGISSPNEKGKIWFRRAIEVARKRGVDLHTLTNRNQPRHQIEFPEAPDKYDLKTGPWGERPADWVFNVYTGRREPKGCGKCGKCDVCFGYYRKELWDALEKEPRRVMYDGVSED